MAPLRSPDRLTQIDIWETFQCVVLSRMQAMYFIFIVGYEQFHD
jgi:hypothetical protein